MCHHWVVLSSRGDFDIGFLVKAIGGPHLLYALGKSHGLASWRTVKHHFKIPKLLPSVGIPSADEISQNVSSFFDPEVKPPLEHAHNSRLPGNVVMFDGIALETRCCYCPKQDKILGLCREHSHNVNTQVDSVESVEKIRAALDSQDSAVKVCFGSDATVVAIAQYSDDKYYTPVPVVASASDKTEKADGLANWIQTVLDVWKTHKFGEKVNGPIWALASDGDSTYCAAKFKICMLKQLQKDSYLGKLLCDLLGLNCFTSKDGATLTGDPKHIFK